MRELVQTLERAAPGEGMQPTTIPFAQVNRRSRTRGATEHVLPPSVWIYVAGQKRAFSGRETRELSPGDAVAIARPTTVVSEILRVPFLCVRLTIHASLLADLAAAPRATSSDITDPFARLVRLLDAPSETAVLAPLLQRELFFRLLAGPAGNDLRELARGHDAAVASAVAWLDAHDTESFRADLLAAHVHLSVSALYARFKAHLGVTPLQYQKRRRLEAARRLLLVGDLDVSTVAYRVGYTSAAHFSRDYRRAFATSPSWERGALKG
jgi:AraC-like DNA-binding protein